MIAPYESIIRSVWGDIVSLGFQMVQNSSHEMIFRSGNISLMFSTERYADISLIRVLEYLLYGGIRKGFHVGTVMSVVAPERFNQKQYGQGRSYEGIKNDLQFELQFLKDYENTVFRDPPRYIDACIRAEKAVLREAGFHVDDYEAPSPDLSDPA